MSRKFMFPQSSNIQSVSLNYAGTRVTVVFKSVKPGLMTYYQYPLGAEEFYKIVHADSVGSMVHQTLIKPKLPCTKTSRQRDEKTGRFVKAV